jgi:ribosomal protein S27AE
MKKENICPKCGEGMTRYEHPDGYCCSPWSCNYCGYSEEIENCKELTKEDLESLPF